MAARPWFWRGPNRRKRDPPPAPPPGVALNARDLATSPHAPQNRYWLNFDHWKSQDDERRAADRAVARVRRAEAAAADAERTAKKARRRAAYEEAARSRPPPPPRAAEARARPPSARPPPAPAAAAKPRRDYGPILARCGGRFALRWYFRRVRRYASRRAWAARKRKEKKALAVREDWDRTAVAKLKRDAAASKDRSRWRRPEWRSVTHMRGKLGPSNTPSERAAALAAKFEGAHVLLRFHGRRERGWAS